MLVNTREVKKGSIVNTCENDNNIPGKWYKLYVISVSCYIDNYECNWTRNFQVQSLDIKFIVVEIKLELMSSVYCFMGHRFL